MNDQLDPQAMALTKAIRQVESGGNFKARSKDGSFGAYQFLKPTWDNTARKYGVNAEWEKATPQQQNEVAYKQIKEWKDKGHNVGEIASMWNAGAGRPQAYLQGLKGTNSSGVNYNVANYAKKVATLYQEYKGQSQPQVQQEPIEPVEPIEPTIPEQKQVIQTQGQPVSVRKDRTQPTLVGGILREVIKAPLKAALSVARPFVDPFGKKGGLSVNTKYLGNVGDYGTEIEKSSKNLSNKYKAGDISLGRAAIGGAGAGALQAMDAASVVPVGGVAGSAVKGTLKEAVIPTFKTAAKESLIRGGAISTGYDVSNQLASGEKYKPLQTLAAGTIGTVADFGLSYGLPKALNKGKDILVKTPEQMSAGVDKDINKIYSNVTGDSGEIFKRKASFKRGIERLIQSDINVVSEKSPVGGKKIKNPLDPVKSSPNELINGLNNLSKQFAGKARANTVEATRKGIVLDTTATENFIRNAIDNKDIGRSAGEDLLTQIKRTEGRPVDLHDWVQNQVNMKFFKNNGDLASSKIATVADDAAKIMRKEIDTVVDRTGYAQAYGDNQELKKVMLSIAKSANKDFPFVDMATDAGIDAGISILTGNPAYMARTFATGLFKSVARNVKNQKGIGAFRNINKALKKTTITTKLPESGVKEGIFNYKSVGNPLPPVNTSKSTTATTDKIITSKTIPTLSNTTGNKASIPVMMTNKLRADLKNLGYTPDDIANLKPVEANKIVNEGLKPRNTIIDVKSNTTQLPKSKVKSSDLSTGVKKAFNDAKDTLKTLKDKNVRERGSISLESILPESKSVGNQGVSLSKNTTEDLIQQAKKYKSAEDFVKAQGDKPDLFSGYTPFKADSEYANFYSELKKKYGDYALVNLTDAENAKLVKLSKNNIPSKGTPAPKPVEQFRGTKDDVITGDELFHATTPDRIDKIATEGLKINTGGREAMSTRGEINPLFFSDSPNHALGFIQDLKNEMLIPENTKGVLLRVRGLPKENLVWDSLGKNNSAMSGGSWSFDKNIPAKYIEIKENGVWKPLLDKTKSQLTDIWNKTNKKVTLPKSSDLSTEAKKYKSAEELFKGIKEALKRNEYNIEELFPDRIGYKSTMNAEQMLKSAKDNLDRARNKTVREGGTGRPTKEYAESLKFWENSVKEKKDILNKLEENNSLYESTKDNYSNTKVLERLKELKRISEDDYNLLKTFLDYQLENGAITDMSQLTDIWNKANKKILPKNTKLIRNKDGSVEYGSQKMSGDFKGMPDIEIIKMFDNTPF